MMGVEAASGGLKRCSAGLMLIWRDSPGRRLARWWDVTPRKGYRGRWLGKLEEVVLGLEELPTTVQRMLTFEGSASGEEATEYLRGRRVGSMLRKVSIGKGFRLGNASSMSRMDTL